MHIAEIDRLSVSTKSKFHTLSASSKGIFALTALSSIIIANTFWVVLAVIGVLMALIASSRVPLGRVLHLAMYPAFFSLLFAVMSLGNGLAAASTIVVKAVGAALAMLFLITTTPYVDLFALFSKFMPALLVDVFFMTYRSFFILLEKIEHLLVSVKLRGGYKPWHLFLNLKTVASLMGTLIVQSIEMSERMYKIYGLRGYNGKMPTVSTKKFNLKRDGALIVFGIIILLGVILWQNSPLLKSIA